jgi:hypothetical protein
MNLLKHISKHGLNEKRLFLHQLCISLTSDFTTNRLVATLRFQAYNIMGICIHDCYVLFNSSDVDCGLVIDGMWAEEKGVPTLPYVLYTALPSSPDLSQYPDRQGSWESVVAILHFQTGQTSEELGFCKITFMQIESPLKISEA